jgi:hypothetical protein
MLASDAERARTVEQLSLHCSRGRLSLDEFERRVGEAYEARTVEQLDALVSDVPREPRVPARRESGVGPPGLWPFSNRIELDASAARIHKGVLENLAPGLHRFGYELQASSDTELVFERRGRPAWVPFVAIFAFPIGLAALAVHESQRIVITLDARDGAPTVMTVYGRAPRAVRKVFAELRLG